VHDKKNKYAVSSGEIEIPAFSVVEIGFDHALDRNRGLPYSAGAVIDIDNDGKDELFLGGGIRQSDGLFRYLDDRFVNVVDKAEYVKQGDGHTLGAVVFDIDANGFQDLIVSREDFICLYRNNGGRFSLQLLDIDFPPGGVPLAVSIADLNRDGHFDFIVPFTGRGTLKNWYLLKDSEKEISPKLYINNGDDTFSDITDTVGLGHAGGALQTIFTDLDEDGLEDIVVLYSNGILRTWKNRGNLLFENKYHSMSNHRGDYQGMGVGDYNGDGRVDFLLTNRGSTIPKIIADLLAKYRSQRHPQWVLMKNMGFFSFHNEASGAQVADYELARGALFEDINGDGLADLLVSQNHPYWPLHYLPSFRLPGRILLQDNDGKFLEAQNTHIFDNFQFGMTPLAGDFNGDGLPDIAQINIGGRSTVLLNKGGKNHFLKVVLPDTARSLGAIVRVKMLSGKIVSRPFLVGRNIGSDSSHALFFGLGQEKATDVMVQYVDGKKDQTSGVLLNTIVVFQ